MESLRAVILVWKFLLCYTEHMRWFKKREARELQSSEQSSLDLAFLLTKELIAAQLQDVNALDTKASFALGAGTGIVSAALILQSLLLPSHAHSSCSVLIPNFLNFLRLLPLLLKKTIPIFPLLIAYIIVIAMAFNAYRTRDYKQIPEPRAFLDNLDKTAQYCKESMFPEMVDAYEWNKEEAVKKAEWIDRALLALVFETLALALLVIYQVGC